MESVSDGETVGQAGGQREGRGENSAGGEDNPQKEQVLRHGFKDDGIVSDRKDGNVDGR
jgi:hypothetical protein